MRFRPVLCALCFLITADAFARDDVEGYSIEEALSRTDAQELLGDRVSFYFGDQSYGSTVENYGEFSTNKKTNAFGKSDKEACQWAFYSALISLRDRTLQKGGNAVVDIKSNYKSNLTVSDDTFQCGAGAIMAGVALVGTVVKISE